MRMIPKQLNIIMKKRERYEIGESEDVSLSCYETENILNDSEQRIKGTAKTKMITLKEFELLQALA